MIGFDFPVKPQWIHDVLALWQPQQPIGELVRIALAETMQELGGEKTRRNTLTVILRYFVATEGGGQSRRTGSQELWADYAHVCPAAMLAPAYLAHIIAQNEVAQEATRFLVHRYSLGEKLASGQLRQYIAARFGQRKVTLNAASAFLRTLHYFGVLSSADKPSEYQFTSRLPVPQPTFPLVVWVWWQRHLSPQINLDEFEANPMFAFLQSDQLRSRWQAHQPALWVLEERVEGRRAVLKHPEADEFEQALIETLPR